MTPRKLNPSGANFKIDEHGVSKRRIHVWISERDLERLEKVLYPAKRSHAIQLIIRSYLDKIEARARGRLEGASPEPSPGPSAQGINIEDLA